MNKIKTNLTRVALTLLARSIFAALYVAQPSTGFAQATAFTYQGELNNGAYPASGSYDFRFRLASDSLGNNYVGSPVLTNGVPVGNGLFTVSLDFGSVFNGSNYWLEVDVRTNGTTGYSVLAPLQALTATPYALYAMTPAGPPGPAGTNGAQGLQGVPGVSPFSLAGTNAYYLDGWVGIGTSNPASTLEINGIVSANSFSGGGAGLTSLNPANLSAGTAAINISGNATTATTAANLSGNVGDGQLSANVARLNGTNLFTGSDTFATRIVATNGPNLFDGTFDGDGGGLTNLSANTLSSGIVPDGRLAANVERTNQGWLLAGNGGTTPGTQFVGTTDNQSLEFRVNNTRALRFEPTVNNSTHSNIVNVIGGSPANFVSTGVYGATIAGGGAAKYSGPFASNQVTADFGTVGGGVGNAASNTYATVSGGRNNFASGVYSTVCGGWGNSASGDNSAVTGGVDNSATGDASAVSGYLNTASGTEATVIGGYGNTASGESATVAGGYGNIAAGDQSFAAGYEAQALYDRSFVWSDGSTAPFASTAQNQFSVLAAGGVLLAADVQIGKGGADYRTMAMGGGNSTGYLYAAYNTYGDGINLGYNYYFNDSGNGVPVRSDGPTSRITAGYGEIVLAVGGDGAPPSTVMLDATAAGVTVYGTFNNESDRHAKQDFTPISPSDMLDKVLQLPVSEWSYKTDSATRHIGPMAQDFSAVFEIGTDDKHIAPMDESGIALAAIQGLNQKLEQTRIENAELRHEVGELKQLVMSLDRKLNTGLK